MERCRETAFCLLATANVALMFALILMLRTGRLTEADVTDGQFWRTVPVKERPLDEGGARIARRALRGAWLSFAKGAAAVAIVLSTLAYISNGVSAVAWSEAVRAQGMMQAANNSGTAAAYRAAD